MRGRWTPLVGLAGMLATLAAPPALAGTVEWRVRRSTSDAALQSARALMARPESAGLASRLVGQAGRRGTASWLERLRARADASPNDYSAQMAYAQLLLAARQWPRAAERFASAVMLAPDAFAPRWGRARALLEGGAVDPTAAPGATRDSRILPGLAALREALARARAPSELRLAAAELTTVAVAAGDTEAEVEARRASQRAGGPNGNAAYELSDARGRAGRPLEAATILTELRATLPGGGEAGARTALLEAKHRTAGHDLEGAALALEWARKADPRSSPARLRSEIWERSTEVARRRGMLDALAGELARPRDAVEWAALAQIRDEASDLQGAREAIGRAARLAPRDLALRRRQLALERRLGSSIAIAGIYQAMAWLRPGDPQLVSEVIDELGRMGQGEAAGQVFDRALAAGRRRAPMLRALAEAAGRAGDDRRAVAAWTALRRVDPTDELAVVALGEVELQRGRKRAAMDIWRGLLRRPGAAAADGHARLAEVLADHDLLREAIAEARLAIESAPKEARLHRLLALILERQPHLAEAEAEWRDVLRLALATPAAAGERREARAHLATLWVRQGQATLERRLQELADQLGKAPTDVEAATFLVEAQLRAGRTDAAATTLRALLTAQDDVTADTRDGDRDHTELTPSSATADLVLLVARTLRQAQRSQEATAWLEEVARRFPERARDVHLQLADIALAGHGDTGAERHAAAAAAMAPDDPQVLLRVAAVEDRLGRLDQAESHARRAYALGRDPSTALALSSLLVRRGEMGEPRALLRETLSTSQDDEVIAEAGRRAIALEEATGTLDDLATFIADLPASAGDGQARSRLLLTVLGRLIPAMYRDRDGALSGDAGAARHRRLAQNGLRTMLDAISRPDAAPSLEAIELLGMLGRAEAVPALLQLLSGSGATTDTNGGTPARSTATPPTELVGAVVVALGRIGAEAARPALEPMLSARDRSTRLAALWALGRLGGDAAVRVARRELATDRSDAAAVACLTVGKRGGVEAIPLLAGVASDRSRAALVRRAAVAGLALGRHTAATPALLALLDSDDDELARAAGLALAQVAAVADVRPREAILRTLLESAVPVSAAHGPLTVAGARAGLEEITAGEPPPDEALAIRGGRIDPEALIGAALGTSAYGRGDARPPWWWASPQHLASALMKALAGPAASRRAALRLVTLTTSPRVTLDATPDHRSDLVPIGSLPPRLQARTKAQEIVVSTLRPLLPSLLADDDAEVRALSLALAVRIDPLRYAPAAAAPVATELKAMLGAPSWYDRVAAIEVVARLAPADSASDEIFLAATADPSAFVRAAAALALRSSKTSAARRRLGDLARDESAAVRAAALGLSGDRAQGARRVATTPAPDLAPGANPVSPP